MNILKQYDASQAEGHTGGGDLSQPNKHQKGFPVEVDGQILYFDIQEITVGQLLEKAGKTPITCFSVYRKLKGCDFEFIHPDKKLDIADPALEHFVIKDPVVFSYTVDTEPETTDHAELSALEILHQKNIDSKERYLVLEDNGREEIFAFKQDFPIKMKCPGLHFLTKPWLDTAVIEEYGKSCIPLPAAHTYILHIDKEDKPWNSPTISVPQLLGLVGKQPEKFNLLKFYSNNPKPIMVDAKENIDLLEKCLVRFVTQPKTQTDGFSGRRHFRLPIEDEQALDALGYPWETLSCGSMWLLIYNYPLPNGYTASSTTIGLLIPPTYPATEIDMAYFYPDLVKVPYKPISALSSQSIDGKTFQRWSRHRLAGEWQPGIDSVITHLSLVDNWLIEDLKR